jgi:eukaryotic-like serine/threonine-protein kinase
MSFISNIKSFVWSKQFLKLVLYLVITYILVVFFTIYYLDFTTNHGEKIKVPILVGKNVRSIAPLVEDLGLKYEVLDSIYEPKLAEGTILSQDPRPTDSSMVYVKSGRIIKLRVSKKNQLVEMPSLIYKSERFAISVLKNRGLKYSISYKPTSEANGAVLEQRLNGNEIKEGIKIPIKSVIQLVVGRNEVGQPVQIPNLIGLTINEVNARLSSLGRVSIFATYINCANASDSSAARVLSQSPEYIEGQLSPSNTTVTLQLDKNFSGGNN